MIHIRYQADQHMRTEMQFSILIMLRLPNRRVSIGLGRRDGIAEAVQVALAYLDHAAPASSQTEYADVTVINALGLTVFQGCSLTHVLPDTEPILVRSAAFDEQPWRKMENVPIVSSVQRLPLLVDEPEICGTPKLQ